MCSVRACVCWFDCLFVSYPLRVTRMRNELEFSQCGFIVYRMYCVTLAKRTVCAPHIVHNSVYAGAEMSLFMSERIRPNDK